MTLHPLTTFYNNDYGTLFALKRAEFARTVMHGGVTPDRMRMTLAVPQSATHLLDVEVSLLYCSLPIHSWNSIAGTPDPGYPWVETYKTSKESSRRSRLEKAVVANASWRKAQRPSVCHVHTSQSSCDEVPTLNPNELVIQPMDLHPQSPKSDWG